MCGQIEHSVLHRGAAGILFLTPDPAVLLCRRADDGTWALPGGHMEENEVSQQTAVRETQEELGITLSGELTPLATVERPGVTFFAYLARCDKFRPRLNEEHTACGWFLLDNPPAPLHPGMRGLLDLARRH